MRYLLLIASFVALNLALGCGSGGGKVITGAVDGGSDGGTAYTSTSLASMEMGTGSPSQDPFSVAIASDGRIGIAYYWDLPIAGAKELDYLEIRPDGTSRNTTVETGMLVYDGVSNTFDNQGNAIISWLGRNPTFPLPVPHFADGGLGNNYWSQFCLAIATLPPDGGVGPDGGVATVWPSCQSMDVDPPNAPPVAIDGNVVGLSSSVVAEADGGLISSYRDIHYGQFPKGDFGESNWNASIYSGGKWTDEYIQIGTDMSVAPNGGLGELAMLVDGPFGVGAICSSQGGVLATSQDLFYSRLEPAGWTGLVRIEQVNDISNGGPRGAFMTATSSVYGITYTDYKPTGINSGSQILYYTESSDGVSWINPEQVFGSGSGGWEPSLAYNPVTGEATVAYYICSAEPGATSNCPASQQSLAISIRRAAGHWAEYPVDLGGGRLPIINFDASGNLIIIYRDVTTGALKMAKPTTPAQ